MKKWRLNFFDVAIIVVVLAVGAVFVYMQRGANPLTGAGTGVTVRYVIEITNMTQAAVDKIRVGDSITDKIEKHAMGRVVDFAVSNWTVSSRDLNTGDYKLQEIPERYTVLLTLESPAVESVTSFTIDGAYKVRCGTETNALGPGYGGVGYIVDVERDGKLFVK